MIARPGDGVLLLLIISIAALLLVTLSFAVIVVILHLRNERRARNYAAQEALWEPALMDALTGESVFDDSVVAARDRPQFIWYLVRYARRLRGEERTVLQSLAAPHLPWIAERTRHGSAEVRARAVQTLTTLGMPEYADRVVAALDDDSPLVAMTAARGLSRPEHAAFSGEVLSRVERFGMWNHRFLASMLSAMGQAAVPELRRLLGDASAAEQARVISADALGQLRDLASADLAAGLLTSDSNRNVVAAALGLLGVIGSEQHLERVVPLLRAEESWVRAQAVETLARLGSRAHTEVLSAALLDESPWVALRAAYGLSEIGADDELRRLSAQDDDVGNLAREVLSRNAA